MAIGARGNLAGRSELVRIGQREACGAVVELPVGPHSDRMATGAGGSRPREIGGDVIGNVTAQGLRLVPIRLMAREAVRGSQ